MKGDSRDAIRQAMLYQRAALDRDTLQHSAQSLLQNLKSLTQFRKSKRISAYIAVKGEIDPSPALAWAREQKAVTYLPIAMYRKLRFAPYNEQTTLVAGDYNIPVPDYDKSELINADELDLVLVPMVAFDKTLNRLGMGGGYYDRSFAFRSEPSDHPYLVGVAHDFQGIDQLPAEPWDIPMDAIVTDEKIYFPPYQAL